VRLTSLAFGTPSPKPLELSILLNAPSLKHAHCRPVLHVEPISLSYDVPYDATKHLVLLICRPEARFDKPRKQKWHSI
jgi:hypothetical protein